MLRFPPRLADKRNWMRGIYRPSKMRFLRFLLHLRFVHIGIAHYVFNMIMQLLVGVFLEMEQV